MEKTVRILEQSGLITRQCHLKDNVRNTIFREFLDKLLFDPAMKDEARKKLKGSSRKKYLCWIIANLSDRFLFKPETTSAELAHSLHTMITDLEERSIKSYIDKNSSDGSRALRTWTRNIMDDLLAHPHNPFAGLFG